MTEAKIKSNTDADLPFRNQIIKANNKTLLTPIKSVDPKHLSSSLNLSNQLSCINELYSGITSKKILNHQQGNDNSLPYFFNSAEKKFRKPDEEMKLCFLEFKEESYPTKKEVEFMADLAYVYSDITPIPMLSGFKNRITTTINKSGKEQLLPNDAKFKKFLSYLEDVIETIQQLNNKPIMGYIPDFRFYFEELVKFYEKKGINTFYYDTHLSSPMTLQLPIRSLLRELNNQDMLENSYIHLLNPGYGRASKDSSIIPAKDIMGFGLGIDGLGERHMRRVFTKQLAEYMKKNPDNRSRLFNKKTYGYVKTAKKSEIESFFPNDSGIDIANFLKGKPENKIQNAFNVEQLALESTILQESLNSNKPILKYISKKENVKETDIKIMKRAKIKLKK